MDCQVGSTAGSQPGVGPHQVTGSTEFIDCSGTIQSKQSGLEHISLLLNAKGHVKMMIPNGKFMYKMYSANVPGFPI